MADSSDLDHSPVPPQPADQPFLSVKVAADGDDGTEINNTLWCGDGYAASGDNRAGAVAASSYDYAMRFRLPSVRRGDTFVYARLALPASDSGQVSSLAKLRIVGINQDSPVSFDVVRPSQLPKTTAAVAWSLCSDWPAGAGDSDCYPLRRYSPDISAIINQIVARPSWGTGAEEKTLAIVIENADSLPDNVIAFEDYRVVESVACPGQVVAPALELYRTVRATFLGKELLSRPTDHSVTVSALALLPLEAYLEYDTTPTSYGQHTQPLLYAAAVPIEVVIGNLIPDTRYYYRIRFRRPGQSQFQAGPQHTFQTQRFPGSEFVFTVASDSHIYDRARLRDQNALDLYCQTLNNVAADGPDFHLDLGDTFLCESYAGRDVLDFEEAVWRHLYQRPYLDLVTHSSPLFLALGNHEGEQGWRLDGTADNLAVWAANARKLVYPLPIPDAFYTGNLDQVSLVGLREDYYAWHWGDALFVVLDPYWYTTTKPHDMPEGEPGSGDNWDWTLGWQQFAWLADTLQNSPAAFKFVFAHQVVGGVNTYGRGGVEAASHDLGGCGSFEWGGEDLYGRDVFRTRRPGWGSQPIHYLLADNNVTIFFHGHDHVFVRQELDGVVYQACPQPSDGTYGCGHYVGGLYLNGDMVENSGHVRVRVTPTRAVVEYVRAYLPGDGPNGEIAYSYSVSPPTGR